MCSTGCIDTRFGVDYPPGSRRWKAFWLPETRSRCRHEPRAWGKDRQRRALRRVHVLSLPAVFGEEPAALDVRRDLSASVQPGAGGTDAWTMQTECLVVGDQRTVLD